MVLYVWKILIMTLGRLENTETLTVNVNYNILDLNTKQHTGKSIWAMPWENQLKPYANNEGTVPLLFAA